MLDLEQFQSERLRPFSRAEYDRMVELGFFEDEKVELLRGALVELSPQGNRHHYAVRQLTKLLLLPLHERAEIICQGPYAASDHSEPEPDVSVVPAGAYLDGHPRQAHLVIEVADSSLRRDRGIKRTIYAENGVPEYWIVNLQESVIEVHTDPHEGAYRQVKRYDRSATITLGAFPDVAIAVADVIPT